MNSTTQQPTYELLKDISMPGKTVPKGSIFSKLSADLYVCKDVNPNHYVDAAYIDDTDWFRRVEVKDWEVEEFVHTSGGAPFILNEDKKYFCEYFPNEYFTLDDLLHNKNGKTYNITKVKRLSDGETFTVGEKATYGVITSFKISNGEMGVVFHELDPPKPLSTISKLPSTPPVEQETIKVEIEQSHWDNRLTKTDDKGSFREYRLKVYPDSELPDSKKEAVKKAIEDVLNEGSPKWEFPKERFVGIYDSVLEKVIKLYKSIVDMQAEEIARLKKEKQSS